MNTIVATEQRICHLRAQVTEALVDKVEALIEEAAQQQERLLEGAVRHTIRRYRCA